MKRKLVGCIFTATALTNASIAVADAQQFEECLNITEKHSDAINRASALLNCVESLAKGQMKSTQPESGLAVSDGQFDAEHPLIQVHVQSMCSAKAPNSTGNIRAVLRRPLGQKLIPGTDKMRDFSGSCSTVCDSFLSTENNRMSSVGGIHVYANNPPFPSGSNGNYLSGLSTYVYNVGQAENEFYGPNYCCCHG